MPPQLAVRVAYLQLSAKDAPWKSPGYGAGDFPRALFGDSFGLTNG